MKIIISEQQYRVLMSEQTLGTTECYNVSLPRLNQAIDFWRKWLLDPATKTKIMSLYRMNEKKLDRIYVKYFKCLDNIKLQPVLEIPPKLQKTYAWVDRDVINNIIYINCEKVNEPNADWVGFMIHEIQHLLGMIYPLSPPRDINNIFASALKPKDKNSDGIPIVSDIVSNNLMASLGVSKDVAGSIQTRWGNKLMELDANKRKYYICNLSEKYSNIMAIRNLFNVRPGQSITVDMLKPYILMEKKDTNVSLLLGCWAIRGYSNLETFLGGINQLATNNTNSEKRPV